MDKSDQIKKSILDFAKKDKRVRAVLLNGSRANPNIQPDKYQDYDILFVVSDFDSFLKDENWISIFGNTIIKQLPDKMMLGRVETEEKFSFAWLMLFEDGNRIDLTLFAVEKFHTHFEHDNLTMVWMDKDSLFDNIPEPSDKDYYIKKPAEIEFCETCNEFWWVSTYIAKGLARRQIIYAKDMTERVVRPMLMKLIEWKIGVDNNFSVSIGASGKFVDKFLDENLYQQLINTYSDSNIENNWKALTEMTILFKTLQQEVAEKLNFYNNSTEANKTFDYIMSVKNESDK